MAGNLPVFSTNESENQSRRQPIRWPGNQADSAKPLPKPVFCSHKRAFTRECRQSRFGFLLREIERGSPSQCGSLRGATSYFYFSLLCLCFVASSQNYFA